MSKSFVSLSKMTFINWIACFVFFFFSSMTIGQPLGSDFEIGGDIFSDFSDDLDEKQIAEDERFYRYGRFFSVAFGFAMTSFTGNRGLLYKNDFPSFVFALTFFMSMQHAIGLGLDYSQHHFAIDSPVYNFNPNPPGLAKVSIIKPFLSYRYYWDTSNMPTALTFANPYVTGRVEFWRLTNTFEEIPGRPSYAASGIATSLGLGLEFPIKYKESYLNLQFLYHLHQLSDKHSTAFAPIKGSNVGYQNLSGDALSGSVSYVFSW